MCMFLSFYEKRRFSHIFREKVVLLRILGAYTTQFRTVIRPSDLKLTEPDYPLSRGSRRSKLQALNVFLSLLLSFGCSHGPCKIWGKRNVTKPPPPEKLRGSFCIAPRTRPMYYYHRHSDCCDTERAYHSSLCEVREYYSPNTDVMELRIELYVPLHINH